VQSLYAFSTISFDLKPSVATGKNMFSMKLNFILLQEYLTFQYEECACRFRIIRRALQKGNGTYLNCNT
jgi:hypothetical protein